MISRWMGVHLNFAHDVSNLWSHIALLPLLNFFNTLIQTLNHHAQLSMALKHASVIHSPLSYFRTSIFKFIHRNFRLSLVVIHNHDCIDISEELLLPLVSVLIKKASSMANLIWSIKWISLNNSIYWLHDWFLVCCWRQEAVLGWAWNRVTIADFIKCLWRVDASMRQQRCISLRNFW